MVQNLRLKAASGCSCYWSGTSPARGRADLLEGACGPLFRGGAGDLGACGSCRDAERSMRASLDWAEDD